MRTERIRTKFVRMKYFFSLALSLFFLCPNILFAKIDSLPVKSKKKDTIDLGWRTKKEAGFLLNQVSFTNWNAGGSNSISGIISGKASTRYKKEKWNWNSTINLRYGLNKQEENGVKKTEDVIELNSNLVLQQDSISNWFYSARLSFNTQFANGYKYPNRDEPISKFLAPGYMFFGFGMEYGRHIERFSFYASPFTLKTTFVMDSDLANRGSFGVNPAIYDMQGNMVKAGSNVKQEIGILITNHFEEQLFENIKLNSLLRLYTDYVNSFGNIDVEWELNLDMKVNKFVKATLGSHLRYDNDIKIKAERDELTNVENTIEGPRLQWKQILGVGIVVDFNKIYSSNDS